MQFYDIIYTDKKTPANKPEQKKEKMKCLQQ